MRPADPPFTRGGSYWVRMRAQRHPGPDNCSRVYDETHTRTTVEAPILSLAVEKDHIVPLPLRSFPSFFV